MTKEEQAMSQVLIAMEAASILMGFIDKLIQEKKARGELTPEEEVAYDAWAAKKFAGAEWQKSPSA